MSGSDRDKRRRQGLLSDEDAALWRYVTRDVRPTGSKPRVGRIPAAQTSRVQPTAATARVNAGKPAVASKRTPHPEAKPAEAKRSPPRPAEAAKPVVLERRKARRIARGRTEIEARLDLHGMTQDEAHSALTRFIHSCAAGGLRTVLVITGKGGDARDEAGGAALREARARRPASKRAAVADVRGAEAVGHQLFISAHQAWWRRRALCAAQALNRALKTAAGGERGAQPLRSRIQSLKPSRRPAVGPLGLRTIGARTAEQRERGSA